MVSNTPRRPVCAPRPGASRPMSVATDLAEQRLFRSWIIAVAPNF
jgi:hypothetical protein